MDDSGLKLSIASGGEVIIEMHAADQVATERFAEILHQVADSLTGQSRYCRCGTQDDVPQHTPAETAAYVAARTGLTVAEVCAAVRAMGAPDPAEHVHTPPPSEDHIEMHARDQGRRA